MLEGMSRRLVKKTTFGQCQVKIMKDSYAGEFVVQTIVKGKVDGGKDGGYFTDDKSDARSTAAAVIRRLRRERRCR